MIGLPSNQWHYKLKLSALREDAVHVISFQGREAISQLFEYRFDVLSKDEDLDPGQILNHAATFMINVADAAPVQIHGIISHFEQHGRSADYVYYKAVLVPTFWRSTLNFQSVIYQEMNVQDVITKVLEDGGMRPDTDFRFELTGSYPVSEYIAQYRETDWQFINRRAEHYGIFYYFDHSDGSDTVVFADANDAMKPLNQVKDVFYNPGNTYLTSDAVISDLTFKQRLVTGQVRLNDYNYRQPGNSLLVENQIDPEAPGVFYDYGDHYKDTSEGELLARVRNEEIVAQSKLFEGTSDCRLFQAGYSFDMGMHYRKEWNAKYILTEVHTEGDQRSLFAFLSMPKKIPQTYQNTFVAIPEDLVYRPARTTPIPRIHGIMTAKTESATNDEYAYLDDQGRYKVKVPFDLSDNTDGTASREVRMAQPYSGPDYGLHFPNHKDTEMLWSCIDGNPDRILGLGTISNPFNPSPVVADNKMQNVVRTKAGNEMILDDTVDKTWVLLKSADGHQVKLDDDKDNIKVTSTNKHFILMDDKNKHITLQSTSGHFLIFDDENKKVTCQSKDGHRISINDKDQNITLVDESGENTFVIDIKNKKLVIKTEKGDIDMHAPKGTIDIKAKVLKMESTGDTSLKALNIKAKASKDYTMDAVNITEEAKKDLSQKGLNVTSEASAEYTLKGLNVTSEAGVQQNVKGTMTTLEASAINTIKGALVKIN